MEKKADYLFEISWEVCNKVGGIFTVISSKILPMKKVYGDNYFTIGPFFPERNKYDDFKEKIAPDFLKDIFEKLHKQGIKCHFGSWTIEGEPNTILVDYSDFTYKLNEIKTQNWFLYKIDSLNTQYHDYDEPLLWATAVGYLLEEIKNNLGNKKIVAHCHEWLAGGTILYLKSKKAKIGTVFTTHATMLGRTLATNHVDLYDVLDKINPDEQAYKYGIQAKHLTEKACANNADVFTTVSEITGIEATYFLGKKPDVLLPNGLDVESFPTFEDASIKHKLLKAKMRRFVTAYFFPYYQFDLDETLFYFLAGRYEFHDKGIDVFIKALGKVNQKLKEILSKKTIVAFIFVPSGVKDIKKEILENETFYNDIKETIDDDIDELKDRLIYALISKKECSNDFLIGKQNKIELERKLARFKRNGLPPLSTHNLYNEENDAILNECKKNDLTNKPEDRVKIIFYPIYLTGADQLLDLNYYESITASHLGVFPSYYEPWGYTPLETGALGIASVTTDLSGFGMYIKKIKDKSKNQGIYVVERLKKTDDEVVDSLTEIMYNFALLNKQERIENKMRAKRLADTADWGLLAENYILAQNMAVEKIN
ncbi:MAG: glycogen/starch synthase [Candidatus Woesearchaeota archaeon]